MSWQVENLSPLVAELSDGLDTVVESRYSNQLDAVFITTELGFQFNLPGLLVRRAQVYDLAHFVDCFVREYEGSVYEWLGYQSYWQHTAVGKRKA